MTGQRKNPCHTFYRVKIMKEYNKSSHLVPIKNLTCSMSFYVINRRQVGPSPHQIPCQVHVIYPVIFFSMLEHDMDFGRVKIMEFPWHLLKT